MSGIVTGNQGQITATALHLNKNITFEEWQEIGSHLSALAKGMLFWVGDWLNYGEKTYGESYAQAMDITGYSYATVKMAKYISSKFPPEDRNEKLTFTHYSAVVGEDKTKALQLLDKAANDELSVKELKGLRSETAPPKPEKTKTCLCPHCHRSFVTHV